MRAQCIVCESINPWSDIIKLNGTTRDTIQEHYKISYCKFCQSINSLSDVDYDKIYKNYPIKNQVNDYFTQKIFLKRLNILKKLGLSKKEKILDYGCGSGLFVDYLKSQGFDSIGYDPFNKNFKDTIYNNMKYNTILLQDVLEHTDHPQHLLSKIEDHLLPGGRVVIGIPVSDLIDINNPIDQVGILHQPFHRFIPSINSINLLLKNTNLKLIKVYSISYLDTWYPFVNSVFLYNLFESIDKTMDSAFEKNVKKRILKFPKLILLGLFGRMFCKDQNKIILLQHIC